MQANSTEKLLALIAHLGYFSAVGFIFAPLIIWLVQKNESPYVASHALQALIYQVAVAVLTGVFSIGAFVFGLATMGIGALLIIPVALLGSLVLIVPTLIAAYKVYLGEEYSYPLVGGFAK